MCIEIALISETVKFNFNRNAQVGMQKIQLNATKLIEDILLIFFFSHEKYFGFGGRERRKKFLFGDEISR